MTTEDEPTSVFELLDAVKNTIREASAEKRGALAETIDAYAEDFPEEFFWAIGVQAPMLLHHLLMTIDMACRPDDEQSKRWRGLADRKPEGNA